MKFIVSAASSHNAGLDWTELPFTKQTVDDEELAKRLVAARNRHETRPGSIYLWGYYPETETNKPE